MPPEYLTPSKKAGLPPGTILHIGAKKTSSTLITRVNYSPEYANETRMYPPDDFFTDGDTDSILWLDVIGLHQIETIELISRRLNLHMLTAEDIPNTKQRIKIEIYDDYLFIVMNTLYWDETNDQLEPEYICLILKDNCVVSFHEKESELFQPIRLRIQNGQSRLRRRRNADYLLYTLIDAVVDQYFIVLEAISERIEQLEDAILKAPDRSQMEKIHELKQQTLHSRGIIRPMKELLTAMLHEETELIQSQTTPFLKDIADHLALAIEMVDASRETLSHLQELYISVISIKTNEVMKVLSLVATIFIPLTFVAGIYGMNFKYMPELELTWGYPALLGLLATAGVTLFLYFKKKHWW